jgi:hypothetical protein
MNINPVSDIPPKTAKNQVGLFQSRPIKANQGSDTLKHQQAFGPLTPIALAGTLSLAVKCANGKPISGCCPRSLGG